MIALALPALTTLSHAFQPVPLEEQVRNIPLIVYAVLFFGLAGAFISLSLAATDRRVFRNMAIYLLLVGVQVLTMYFGGDAIQWSLIALTAPVLVTVAGEAMRVPNRRWTMLIWPLCLFIGIFAWYPALSFLRYRAIDISEIFLCILIYQTFRHGRRRDREVAAAFTFLACFRWTLSPSYQSITHVPGMVDLGGWHWYLHPMSLILLASATLGFYVRDLIEDRREKQRLAAELEAARNVQQIIVPEQIPTIPGFAIKCIYKPAGEVGGDFFQILPIKDGALIVIGDVSGKGLPAAMTVSLLVGAFRTQAEYTQDPGEILAAVNQRMLNRSGGGFTTCLVMRVDADGKLTVANAGHLAPYREGTEMPTENGLPLGLTAETSYADSTFEICDGQQLTLVTDGVVEARDKHGALFGFDRTAAISTQSAEEIAHAAQQFGQEDDISVISLTRVPASSPLEQLAYQAESGSQVASRSPATRQA
jgi:hypothetical protein